MRLAWEVSSVGRHRAGKRHTGRGGETQDFCSLLRYYVFIAIAAKSAPASEPCLRPLRAVGIAESSFKNPPEVTVPFAQGPSAGNQDNAVNESPLIFSSFAFRETS